MYAIIDRRTWKVVEVASTRGALKAKGLVFNTAHPEQCSPEDLVAAYKGMVSNRSIRRPTPTVMEKLVEIVAEQSEELLPGGLAKEGPVAITRRICNSMRGHSRREVISKCVERGINPHTARTQYQRWFASHRIDNNHNHSQ